MFVVDALTEMPAKCFGQGCNLQPRHQLSRIIRCLQLESDAAGMHGMNRGETLQVFNVGFIITRRILAAA